MNGRGKMPDDENRWWLVAIPVDVLVVLGLPTMKDAAIQKNEQDIQLC